MLDASLRTRPIAIISSHHPDGTIITLSREAREEGLYRGMRVSLARKMTHSVLLLPHNHTLYSRINRYVYQNLSTFTPLVETSGFGQFYLDMSGMDYLYPSIKQAGTLITRTVEDKTNLAGTVGISTNKLVSRISTTVVPETVFQVFPGEEVRFLAPLETPVLPSVHEPQVKKIIRFLFLDQIQHIQVLTDEPAQARVLFGQHSRRLARESHGQDTAAVQPPHYQDHLVEQIVLPCDTNDVDDLLVTVRSLGEQLAYTLRQRRQIARRLRLEIHYTDGFRRTHTGSVCANDDATVLRVCEHLFERANNRRNRIRTILLDAWDFRAYAHQLDLFQPPDPKTLRLSHSLDRVRDRFGLSSLMSAAALNLRNVPSSELPQLIAQS
jgi:DNA polymerase-4